MYQKRFFVTSNGLAGEAEITQLNHISCRLSKSSKRLLRSDRYVVTTGKVYKLVVILGQEFHVDDRTLSNVRAKAEQRGYLAPPVEVAPLLREFVSSGEIERMGLAFGFVVMHEPIPDSNGDPLLFRVVNDDRRRFLDTCRGGEDEKQYLETGFVFLDPFWIF